jgi:hypothetical protein
MKIEQYGSLANFAKIPWPYQAALAVLDELAQC